MIDELIARITANVGLDADLARKAVGMMLAFLKKEGPAAEVDALFNAVPGAAELAADNGAKGGIGGAVMGMMGGGVMALGSQLMGAGLGMGQIQQVSKEVFAFGREKAGEDAMGAIVGAIPGLSQFV